RTSRRHSRGCLVSCRSSKSMGAYCDRPSSTPSYRLADDTMTEPRKIRGFSGLQQAFDEVRFGPARTLNLRASLPTGAEAARRVESWIREQQAQRADELLVITGRGNNSEGGVSVVREAAMRIFHELRRKGIVESFVEHTAG